MLLGSVQASTNIISTHQHENHSVILSRKWMYYWLLSINFISRTKIVNGASISILTIPSLTNRLRTYFNCPTVEGAYLENQGSIGSAGSHFERRIFYNEVTQLNLCISIPYLVYDSK